MPSEPTHQRQELIAQLCRHGGPLDPQGPQATIHNAAWFKAIGSSRLPLRDRQALHQQLVRHVIGEPSESRSQPTVIITAGPPGAGKSTILAKIASTPLVVDADDFKRLLLRHAIDHGYYHQDLYTPALREVAGDLQPLELASLVHEESSLLAQAARRELIRQRRDFVIDTVLSNPASSQRLGKELLDAGYLIEVLDVEVPHDVSRARVRARWEHAATQQDPLGGRWVPSEYLHGLFPDPQGRCISQENADALTASCGAVMRHRRFYAARADSAHALEVDLVRLVAGGTLLSYAHAQSVAAARGHRIHGATLGRD